MSNDLGHREVCAVAALDHCDEPDDFTTHRTIDEIRKLDKAHEKESEYMKIMV